MLVFKSFENHPEINVETNKTIRRMFGKQTSVSLELCEFAALRGNHFLPHILMLENGESERIAKTAMKDKNFKIYRDFSNSKFAEHEETQKRYYRNEFSKKICTIS